MNEVRVSVDTNYRLLWIRPAKALWSILPIEELHEQEIFAREVGDFWVGWRASLPAHMRKLHLEVWYPKGCWELVPEG